MLQPVDEVDIFSETGALSDTAGQMTYETGPGKGQPVALGVASTIQVIVAKRFVIIT